MRDFPVFTTEHGVAGLVLREIPYRAEAYITIHNTQQLKELLQDCVEFCKMAGAEKIFATGNTELEKYPLHTTVVKMQQLRENLPLSDGCLFPVTAQTAEKWRNIYNEKMKSVSNAATMTRMDMEKLLAKGTGYFVHRSGALLGIGIAVGDMIESVIAVVPGAGETVLLALCGMLTSETVALEVASNNIPAMKLYQRLGFQKTAEITRWYRVAE